MLTKRLNEVLWHSPEDNSQETFKMFIQFVSLKFEIMAATLMAQWVKIHWFLLQIIGEQATNVTHIQEQMTMSCKLNEKNTCALSLMWPVFCIKKKYIYTYIVIYCVDTINVTYDECLAHTMFIFEMHCWVSDCIKFYFNFISNTHLFGSNFEKHDFRK